MTAIVAHYRGGSLHDKCSPETAGGPLKIPQAIEDSPAVKKPVARLKAVQAEFDAAERKLVQQRLDTIAVLHAQGLSYAQIGHLIGLTKSRVYQLAREAG